MAASTRCDTKTCGEEGLLVAGPLAAALRALHAAVAPPSRFDPATSHTLSLAMPDLLMPLVPGLLAELAAEAPGVDLDHRRHARAGASARGGRAVARAGGLRRRQRDPPHVTAAAVAPHIPTADRQSRLRSGASPCSSA